MFWLCQVAEFTPAKICLAGTFKLILMVIACQFKNFDAALAPFIPDITTRSLHFVYQFCTTLLPRKYLIFEGIFLPISGPYLFETKTFFLKNEPYFTFFGFGLGWHSVLKDSIKGFAFMMLFV